LPWEITHEPNPVLATTALVTLQRGIFVCQNALAQYALRRATTPDVVDRERLAFERFHRLRGYPDDIVKVAEDLWREAAEAVRQYRATHP
jgi:hypothetical protein